MEFIRKKKKGCNQKVRRNWISAEGYWIVWRKEVFGVSMPACYQACVREVIPHFANTDEWLNVWGFVSKQRLFKTFKAAQAECEQHYRLWTQALAAKSMRTLREVFGGQLPIGIPLWAKKKLNRKAYALLSDVQTVQLAQKIALDLVAIELGQNGPCITCSEHDGNMTQQITTEMEPESKTPAEKHTKKRSLSTKRKKTTTKHSSHAAGKRSRKTKSKN